METHRADWLSPHKTCLFDAGVYKLNSSVLVTLSGNGDARMRLTGLHVWGEADKKAIKWASGLYRFHRLPQASCGELKSQRSVFFHTLLCLPTSAAQLQVQTDVEVGLCRKKFLYYWRELCGRRMERMQFPRLGLLCCFGFKCKDRSPYLGWWDSFYRNTNNHLFDECSSHETSVCLYIDCTGCVV